MSPTFNSTLGVITPALFTTGNERLDAHIRRLPPHAREKIAALENLTREARAKNQAQFEHSQAVTARLVHLNAEVARLEHHKNQGHPFFAENEAELKDLKTRRNEVKAELRELQTPKPLRTLSRNERDRLQYAADFAQPWLNFLEDQDRLTRFVSRRAEFQGTASVAALNDAYKAIDGTVDEIIAILAKPLDIETQLEAARSDVARFAEKGEPNIEDVRWYVNRAVTNRQSAKRQGKIKWPEGAIFGPGLDSSAPIELGTSFVAWLFRDQVEAKLEEMIRANQGEEPGLSIPDRERMEADLRTRLLEEHRIASRFQSELLARGERIEVRNLHPLAFLEIDFGERAKAEERPPQYFQGDPGVPGGVPLTPDQAKSTAVWQGGESQVVVRK